MGRLYELETTHTVSLYELLFSGDRAGQFPLLLKYPPDSPSNLTNNFLVNLSLIYEIETHSRHHLGHFSEDLCTKSITLVYGALLDTKMVLVAVHVSEEQSFELFVSGAQAEL